MAITRLAFPLTVLTFAAGCTSSPQPVPTASSIVAGTVVQSPSGRGLAGATAFTFTAQGFASSIGRPLTYRWDVGDGATATGGPAAPHVYQEPGHFAVQVTVTSDDGQSAAAQLPGGASTTTVTGGWRGLFPTVSDGVIPFALR